MSNKKSLQKDSIPYHDAKNLSAYKSYLCLRKILNSKQHLWLDQYGFSVPTRFHCNYNKFFRLRNVDVYILHF